MLALLNHKMILESKTCEKKTFFNMKAVFSSIKDLKATSMLRNFSYFLAFVVNYQISHVTVSINKAYMQMICPLWHALNELIYKSSVKKCHSTLNSCLHWKTGPCIQNEVLGGSHPSCC